MGSKLKLTLVHFLPWAIFHFEQFYTLVGVDNPLSSDQLNVLTDFYCLQIFL